MEVICEAQIAFDGLAARRSPTRSVESVQAVSIDLPRVPIGAHQPRPRGSHEGGVYQRPPGSVKPQAGPRHLSALALQSDQRRSPELLAILLRFAVRSFIGCLFNQCCFAQKVLETREVQHSGVAHRLATEGREEGVDEIFAVLPSLTGGTRGQERREVRRFLGGKRSGLLEERVV